jgi:hypothetical protein
MLGLDPSIHSRGRGVVPRLKAEDDGGGWGYVVINKDGLSRPCLVYFIV